MKNSHGHKTGVEIIYSPENINIINEYYEKAFSIMPITY